MKKHVEEDRLVVRTHGKVAKEYMEPVAEAPSTFPPHTRQPDADVYDVYQEKLAPPTVEARHYMFGYGRRSQPAVILADFGTSSTKSTLLLRKLDGTCQLEPAISKPAESERPLPDGGREWSPYKYLPHMLRTVLDANLQANKLDCAVQGICCTSTTTSIVALRGRSIVRSIPAIRWDDQRAKLEAAAVENVRSDLEQCPWVSFGADSAPARAIWLASRYKDELSDNTSILEQIDLASFFWTGERVLSETVAARKWGMTNRLPWAENFCEKFSGLCQGRLNAMRPNRIVAAAEPVGRILSVHAQNYGLSPTTQIISAPYDTIAQVLGLGLLHAESAVAVSLGTSMGVCCLLRDVSAVSYTKYGPIPDVPFPDQGLLFDGLRSCGSAIDLVCTMALGPKGQDADYFHRISKCLSDTEPGADGVEVVPYFNGGLRTAIGGVPIIRGYDETKQQHLVRAVFEAIAYHIRLIIEKFEALIGAPLTQILTGGGIAKNAEFIQIIADVSNREVRVTKYPDSGLLGCAVCAAVALNWYRSPTEASHALTADADTFQPSKPYAQRYDKLYNEYKARFLSGDDYHTEETNHVG